jgi:integrase
MPKTRKTKGIYRRGKVYWITFMGLDGKQKHESTGSDLKADAELVLAQRRLDVDQGKEPVTRRRSRNYTFQELADKYLLFTANQKGIESKKVFVRELCRSFGSVKLSAFNLALLEGWQSEKLSKPRRGYASDKVKRLPLKPATVNRTSACLKHMFTKALDWEMVSEDVVKRVRKLKRISGSGERLRYLSLEECQRLLAACDKQLKTIVTLAIHTGCRRGEILGLTWNRVDLKHGFILLDETKSGKRREIPINAAVRDALQGVVRRLDIPYVFWNPETERKRSSIREAFTTACRKAKITDFHFHDLRHTFASQLIMNGVDITTVSRLLGHANLTMTLRYSHLAPNHLKNAVDVMNRLQNGLHDNLHYNDALEV